MDWLRWHHGTVEDGKWRSVARRAQVRVCEVVAVWAAMLENASHSETRGSLSRWDDEVAADLLGMEPGQVAGIREAMQGKVLAGDSLTGWERRNPKRGDDLSTERVRAFRVRSNGNSNAGKRGETRGNAGKRPDKIRLDTDTTEKETNSCAIGPEYPADFLATWDAYPRRMGGNSKRDAAKAWNTRRKDGTEAEAMHAGTLRYGLFCDAIGRSGTEYVMQASRFFGPSRPYEDDWTLPADAAKALPPEERPYDDPLGYI